MKKTMMAGMLALTAWAAVAERLPIDDRFILDGERKLRSWTFNDPEGFKPYGEAKEVMADGVPGIRLVSAGKSVQFYYSTSIPVKSGEQYRISAKVRGTGSCSIGFFKYGPHWEWKGSTGNSVSPVVDFSATPYEITYTLTVEADVAMIRPQFSCNPGGKIEFFEIQVERM